MTRANGWKLLTNMKKTSTSNTTRVLDPILIIIIIIIIIIMIYKLNELPKKLVLKQSRPKPMNMI